MVLLYIRNRPPASRIRSRPVTLKELRAVLTEAELAERKEELAGLTARWEQEKAGLNKIGDLRARLDDLKTQAERLQREGDYEGASRILYGEVPALETHVVVHGDAGEKRDLLSPQTRNAPVAAVGGQTRHLRRDPRTARAEELADVRAQVAHPSTVDARHAL